jgi:nickel transport protein
MKQLNVYKILLILGFCVAHSPLYAHGIKYSLRSGGIEVQASFDNNQPANGLYVYVFAPGSSEKFQTGKTDPNGCFVFFPDRAGEWEVLVFDKMGHRLEIKIPINEAMKVEKESDGYSIPLFLKGVMGISIIFGISGIFFWWKGRKGRVVS